jgi:hypothetical protein
MIGRAWIEGWRRVAAAPSLVAGAYVLTLALAVPLAAAMSELLVTHLGTSLMADQAAEAMNYPWWQEFAQQATGLGVTFGPTIVGFAATLDALSGVLDAHRPIAPIAGAVGIYLLAWVFVLGGAIDRLARQRPTRAFGFFGACGRHVGVLLRLAIVAGLVYLWLFAYVHPWLFDQVYRRLTDDLTVERTAFLVRLALYLAFGAMVIGTNLVFDYAKVRAVVEDRRSAIGALAGALRFVNRHRRDAFGLFAVNSATFLVLLAVWAMVAPVAPGWGVLWPGFVLGQLVVIGRLLCKLHFLASQTSLFQARLAHAEYTAAPAVAWPDSPAAEAIVGR